PFRRLAVPTACQASQAPLVSTATSAMPTTAITDWSRKFAETRRSMAPPSRVGLTGSSAQPARISPTIEHKGALLIDGKPFRREPSAAVAPVIEPARRRNLLRAAAREGGSLVRSEARAGCGVEAALHLVAVVAGPARDLDRRPVRPCDQRPRGLRGDRQRD